MPVDSISAQVGASLVNGIGARGSHVPVAKLKRLTAFTGVESDTPPNTYKCVAVWAEPCRRLSCRHREEAATQRKAAKRLWSGHPKASSPEPFHSRAMQLRISRPCSRRSPD